MRSAARTWVPGAILHEVVDRVEVAPGPALRRVVAEREAGSAIEACASRLRKSVVAKNDAQKRDAPVRPDEGIAPGGAPIANMDM